MIPRIEAVPSYGISRIIKGGWHLAGDHGTIDPVQAIADMARFVEAGITTFDCADIYTGVEELIGAFRRARPDLASRVQVHTKFVPDLSSLATLDRRGIEAIIDRSLRRLGVERLDLVQFHWWDYAVAGYVEAAAALDRLRQAGKIARIGATNFDVEHLARIVDAGVPVATHQVQYSLLDDRPSHGMVQFCADHGIALLCYGTVAGGFISERWRGAGEPDAAPGNRSLVKYRLIIEDFGGWPLFQELLEILATVAQRHDVDIASVATRWVLDLRQVAAAIVGATSVAHLRAHEQIGGLVLSRADRDAIDAVLARRSGPDGEVYAVERDRTGRHGRIMKYELNDGEPHA